MAIVSTAIDEAMAIDANANEQTLLRITILACCVNWICGRLDYRLTILFQQYPYMLPTIIVGHMDQRTKIHCLYGQRSAMVNGIL